MRLLVAGLPGIGKGTHGRRLSADLGIPHIASGELLRDQIADDTPLGREAKTYMDKGDYVPDELMIGMLRDRLAQPDAAKGFILDGYPRTEGQAKALEQMLGEMEQELDGVLVIDVPIDEIVRRLSGRRLCPSCQRAYHMDDDPPKDDERCDDDGTRLERRSDDEPETVRHRLKVYADRTAGLVEHYDEVGLVRRVEGNASIDEVAKRIDEVLGL